MAKRKSDYSIEDQYAQQAPEEKSEAADAGGVQLSSDDVSQMQQLKAQGDQSGDYSQLGSYVAQLLGGAAAPQEAAPSDDNLRESM